MNLNFTMVAQAPRSSLFIWFTMKFVWPPLLRAIEARQKQIADGLAAAEHGKQDLEQAAEARRRRCCSAARAPGAAKSSRRPKSAARR